MAAPPTRSSQRGPPPALRQLWPLAHPWKPWRGCAGSWSPWPPEGALSGFGDDGAEVLPLEEVRAAPIHFLLAWGACSSPCSACPPKAGGCLGAALRLCSACPVRVETGPECRQGCLRLAGFKPGSYFSCSVEALKQGSSGVGWCGGLQEQWRCAFRWRRRVIAGQGECYPGKRCGRRFHRLCLASHAGLRCE